jgi:hypothetical protein
MKTKAIHSAMVSSCALHVLQGVYDDSKGTILFTQKRKALIKNLLADVDPLLVDLLGRDDEVQLQFYNAANAIELLAKWLIDNEGSEIVSADMLAKKIEKILMLTGNDVVIID